jgi:hypothetical protein
MNRDFYTSSKRIITSMSLRDTTASTAIRVSLLIIGLAASAAGLYRSVGYLGVGIAIASVAAAYLTDGVFGVAVLHFGTIAVIDVPSIFLVILLEAATLFLLVADSAYGHRLETGMYYLPVAMILAVGTVSFAMSPRRSTLMASGGLILVIAVTTYGLHRYARVRLGLAGASVDR